MRRLPFAVLSLAVLSVALATENLSGRAAVKVIRSSRSDVIGLWVDVGTAGFFSDLTLRKH